MGDHEDIKSPVYVHTTKKQLGRKSLMYNVETKEIVDNTEPVSGSADFSNLVINKVNSEIMIDKVNVTPIIVHTISFTNDAKLNVIHKTANDLYEFDAYFRSSFPTSNFPTFPKRQMSYPMRDTALCEYLQEFLNVSGVCESEFFKQWLTSILSTRLISIKRPTFSGDLKKEGYVIKRWVLRYVIVKHNFLIYFVSEKEFSKLTLPTVLNLARATVKVVDSAQRTFSITLSSGSQYHFKSSTKELLNEWIVVLESAAQFTNRTPRRRRQTSVCEKPTEDTPPVVPLLTLSNQFLDGSSETDIPEEAEKTGQTHKDNADVYQLCKKLETFELLDAIQLNQIVVELKKQSKEHPEDNQLLRLLRLVSMYEIHKSTRSQSTSRQQSQNSSRKQSLTPLDLSVSSLTERPPTPFTPRSLVVCRICEAKVMVDALAKHTYYCKTLNEICMKYSTDAERLKGISEEAKRVFGLKKTSAFNRIIDVCADASRVMLESLTKQYEHLKLYISVAADLVESNRGDNCAFVFAFYTQKLIQHKTDILGKFLENPTNMRQRFNVLNAGVRLDESWETVGLNDFNILKQFNGGAYSSVYLVRKRVTNDVYAMKVMKKADMIRKNVVDGVLAEKSILEYASARSVVKLFYAFQDVLNLYLVMEFCPGGDLRCLLSHVGALDETTSKIYSGEIVIALEYIHGLGCIHRDLKPDNVLIDKNGHLLLTDFGLSKVGSKIQQTYEDSRLLCTPDYVAPESIVSFQYSRCSDYFSLGCMVYEFVVGIPPFHDETPDGIFKKVRMGKFDYPEDIKSVLSEKMKDFVSSLLRVEPELRLGYLSVNQLKNHPWFEGINWNTLLSESREDIFVPELDDETDTGYFDVGDLAVPKDGDELKKKVFNSPGIKIDQSEKFKKFNCTNVHHLVEENLSLVENSTTADNSVDPQTSDSSQESEDLNEKVELDSE
ncbi:serine/threonine protein kinase, putative [Entamoeba invadens IP1]|uniref:serine/threonine protein kinase, putative n=1 Tax=Entamoeba invadens IP1 TaxID=370355 RepID=UPI0002C3F995|nr:serine/threonine protein kinase, putative [Entamoeba invadens IP1]ELP93503.1 serine/threonine protein kinase, putative [Entamoeba invadens IP1]|eukprot:XP_004260274.1 serine/threonine protein kinase, putative [Entamoeba invadens IP1]